VSATLANARGVVDAAAGNALAGQATPKQTIAFAGTARARTAARIRCGALAILAALLSACAGPGVRPGAPAGQVLPAADAAAREAARAQRVRAAAQWSLSGRIAVSNAGKGGSGRIEWSQRGASYQVALSAPVTRQSWRLSGGADGARLEGLDGGPREGADAAELLFQATGWDIPVAALSHWLRGLPAGTGRDARIVPGPDGRPQSIAQGGWTIAYEWPASGDLPSRLDARRDSARVRLIVDQWQGGVGQAALARPDPRTALLFSGRLEHPLRKQLLTLDLDDPAAGMRANLARGESRPMGLGTGWNVTRAPGWGELRWDGRRAAAEFAYPNEDRAMMFDDTDRDYIDEPALWQIAERYAYAYNVALRQRLQQADAGQGAAVSR